MASKEFNVVAILYPKKGKTDEVIILPRLYCVRDTDLSAQVIGLLQEVAEYVKSKEPFVLRYEINRSLRPNKDGTEEIIMMET